MKKKASNKQSTLTLHQLLGALSFWGTASRTMLFGFVATVILALGLSEAATASAIEAQIMVFIYVLASYLLLDFGYVMIARAYPLQKALDLLALWVADIMLALLYVVPRVVVNGEARLAVDPLLYIIFVPIVALSLRLLLGLLFGKNSR